MDRPLSLNRWQLIVSLILALVAVIQGGLVKEPSYEASTNEDVKFEQTAWSNVVYEDDLKKRAPPMAAKHIKHAKLTTLRPAIHWDTPIHSLDLLKGSTNQSLFFTPEKDAAPNSIVPMATMHFKYKFPVVVLDHTAHVHAVECYEDSLMKVVFGSQKASLLAKDWAKRMVVVTGHSFGNYHKGCVGVDHKSDRYYAEVKSVHFVKSLSKTVEVNFDIVMVSMHDVAAGLVISHGHTSIGSDPTSTVRSTAKASTKTTTATATSHTTSTVSSRSVVSTRSSSGPTQKSSAPSSPSTTSHLITSSLVSSPSGSSHSTSTTTSGKQLSLASSSSHSTTATSGSGGSTSAASGSSGSASTSSASASSASASSASAGSASSGSTSTTSGSSASTTATSATIPTTVAGPTVASFDSNFDTTLDNLIGYFSESNDEFYQQVFPGIDSSTLDSTGTKRANLEKRHWWSSVVKAVAKAVVAVAKVVVKVDVAIIKTVAKVAEAPLKLLLTVIKAIEPNKTFTVFNSPWDFSLPPSWMIPDYNSPFGSGFKIFQYSTKETALTGTKISAPTKFLQKQADGKITLNSKVFSATVFCVSCAFTGTPLTTGQVTVAYPLIALVSATIRIHGPMQMHLEVGLDLTYEIGTSADGTGSISAGNMKKIKQEYKTKNPKKGSDQKQLADLPLDPYEIPGVVTLGATLQLKMGASITVSASGFISVGTDSYWDNYDYTLDLLTPAYSKSTNTKMSLNKPFVNVGVALEATAQAYLGICVMLGLDFFNGKVGIEGGVCDQAGVLAQVVLNLEWDEQTSDSKRSLDGRGFPLGIDAYAADEYLTEQDIAEYEAEEWLNKRETAKQLDVDLNNCQGMGFAVYAYDYAYAEAKIGEVVKDFSIWETSWYLTQSCITLWTSATLDIPTATGSSGGPTATGAVTTTGGAAAGATPTGPVATTADVEPTSPTQAATIGGDYVLLGCYNNPFGFGEEDLDGIFGETSWEYGDAAMTPQLCRTYCMKMGSPYFGLMAGFDCQCGSEINLRFDEVTVAALSACNTPCAGDANYLSGGYETVLVYGRDVVVNSPGCPDMGGDTYTAINGASFDMVCSQDNLGNDLYRLQVNSFAECIEACAAHNQVGWTPQCVGVAWVASDLANDGWPCFLKNGFSAYDDNDLVDAATLSSFSSSFFKRDNDTSSDGDTNSSTDTVNSFTLSVMGGGNLTLPVDNPNATIPVYLPTTSIDFAADPTAYPYYQYNAYPVADTIEFEDVSSDDLNVTTDSLASIAYAGTTDDPSYNDTAGLASYASAYAAISHALAVAAANDTDFVLPDPENNSNTLPGFTPIISLDSTLQVTAGSDGNLYLTTYDETDTDTSLQFVLDDTGVSGLTYAGGLIHMYSDTMSAIGVSRLRASTTEYNVPLTAQSISFVPIANSDPTTNGTYPSLLLAETTNGSSFFFITACVYEDTTLPVKLFLVNDADAGPTLLESEVLQTTITGGVISSCQLVGLSNGADPIA